MAVSSTPNAPLAVPFLAMSPAATALDLLCINTIRGLAMDAVQRANSGHPGMPMGAAPMAHALWTRHLRHNPKNPAWFNRDRFILSAGHGSMLLYSLLHLTGYDLDLDEIKGFRTAYSRTPGHPENHLTPGVEMATGPLGQGVATAVGMAIAESHLAAVFGPVVDHFTYVICSDGDLMEGVAQEACSLAGHLQLGKLIMLYDDNGITIDGKTDLAYTEDVTLKFEALGWHVSSCDGMDVNAVDAHICRAKEDSRPSLIRCRTTIGFGSPNRAGTSKAHGEALGADEVRATKEALGLPIDQEFWIPSDVLDFYRTAVQRGAELESAWNETMSENPCGGGAVRAPRSLDDLQKAIEGDNSSAIALIEPINDKLATRAASGKVVAMVAPAMTGFLGGGADLTGNVNVTQPDGGVYSPSNRAGKTIHYGVREHAMMAAVNGITLHGAARGFGGTFLIFSDYCKPSVRLAALMKVPSIFVFTHDSIGLGEDGPTHQPIEQIAGLRAIPNLNVFRPADGNETAVAWAVALASGETPTALILSRQAMPCVTPEYSPEHPAFRGGYVLRDTPLKPRVTLIATGSEVQLALGAQAHWEAEGIGVRVVSLPSWHLFSLQDWKYYSAVLGSVHRISVEAASSFGWARYANCHISVDRFGMSAPGEINMKEFGFTVENVVRVIRGHLER